LRNIPFTLHYQNETALKFGKQISVKISGKADCVFLYNTIAEGFVEKHCFRSVQLGPKV